MRPLRRSDTTPRVELMPLIDVVFLLLTFFIYSLIISVRAEVLPVELVPLATGQSAEPGPVRALTIDPRGELFWDQEPIESGALEARLDALAAEENPPTLYLAMSERGETDRGPQLLSLIEQVRSAGLTNFVIVGRPVTGAAPSDGDAAP